MSTSFGSDVRLTRIGATDQVAQQLRVMIADGRLPQGARLPEIPLSEALGVSRNTLRDGIRVLALEGLLTHVMNRGAMVRVMSAEDVSDIYDIRRRLELEALAAVAAAPEDVQRRTTAALDACAVALTHDNYADFVEHELEFHAALVAHLGSPRLDRFFAQVIGELRLLFSDLSSDNELGVTSAILKKLREAYVSAQRGKPARAQKILRDHLDAYEARLRQLATERLQEHAPPLHHGGS